MYKRGQRIGGRNHERATKDSSQGRQMVYLTCSRIRHFDSARKQRAKCRYMRKIAPQ